MVVFGPGALLHFSEARSLFHKLALAIYEEIVKEHDNYLFPYYFLGFPHSPYLIDETVFTTLSDIAMGLDDLLALYPPTTVEAIDLILHSLSGTAVLWWVVNRATLDQLSRIRSIITINSPLVGSDEYWAAYQKGYGDRGKLFLGRYEEPRLLDDLREGESSAVASIQRPSRDDPPFKQLYTIGTREDELVDPDHQATVSWVQDGNHFVIEDVRRGEQILHNRVLEEDQLTRKVVEILRELPG